MATLAETGAVERLTSLVDAPDRYDYSPAELRDAQVAAMNERFQDRVGRIKLLKLRAEEAGIGEIASLEDAVPLLLPHTAYKSYPESFLLDEKWDKLTRWLGTVSTYPVDNTDLEGIANVDEWIAREAAAGRELAPESIPFPETRAYVKKVLRARDEYRARYAAELGF